MSPFEVLVPATLDEALRLMNDELLNARPVSGCTAISLMMKAGVLNVSHLISLEALADEHASISVQPDGAVRIGALSTIGDLERHPGLQRTQPMLAKTFETLANTRVRNVAMVGGYLAHGDPHMDLPPVLSALGASVLVQSVDGSREIKVEDLYAGYYETTLQSNELITALVVPPQPAYAAYVKVTARAKHDWPTLGVAAAFGAAGQTLDRVRLFIGAATDKPSPLARTAAALQGKALDSGSFSDVADLALEEAPILGDSHGSREYKQALLRAYLPQVCKQALKSHLG